MKIPTSGHLNDEEWMERFRSQDDAIRETALSHYLSFGRWLRTDAIRQLSAKRAALYCGLGGVLSALTGPQIVQVASTAVLPLSGLLIALTFAWIGNWGGLVSSETARRTGKFAVYRNRVFQMQFAALLVFCALFVWAALAAGLAYGSSPPGFVVLSRTLANTPAFALLLFATHAAWGVVVSTQSHLLLDQIASEYARPEE